MAMLPGALAMQHFILFYFSLMMGMILNLRKDKHNLLHFAVLCIDLIVSRMSVPWLRILFRLNVEK